jgi:hypothetical protein
MGKVATGRQSWPALVGVESLAESFDVAIEAVIVEDLIQARIERMRGAPRQIGGRHPYRCLLRVAPSFAHCHRPTGQYVKSIVSIPTRVR